MWERILLRPFGSGRRGSGTCPGEAQLAAYAEQQVSGSDRQQIEHHLAGCNACVRQIAFLKKTLTAEAVQPPPELLQRARELGQKGRVATAARWRWAAAGAAAGVIVLVGVWSQRSSLPPSVSSKPTSVASSTPALVPHISPSGARPSQASEDAVRGAREASAAPTLLVPTPGAAIAPDDLKLEWSAIRGARWYEVRIVSSAGDLVWASGRMHDTAVKPGKLRLRKGETYYVWVRVHTATGAVLQSEAVGFVASSK